MNKVSRFLPLTAFSLALSGVCTAALAQAYPTKSVTIIVPFTAGSATDVIARVVAERLTKDLGQTVLVDNRPGAGGTIGTDLVAKAAPDGHTLLITSNAHAANPALYEKLPYDTIGDFSGITTLATLPNVLITSSSSKYQSVADLISAAQKNPGQLNYASAGSGSATHINAEKFRFHAKFSALHVPFKGTPPAVTETMTQRVDYMFAPIVSALPHIKSGKLRALAVGSAHRTRLLPDVPTTIEAGVPGSDFNFWIGLLAPAKTNPDIIIKLHGLITKHLESPEVKDRFATLGAEPSTMQPLLFNKYIKQEKADLGALIKEAGVKLE
jgi:tripartite-type tricarboxylate transporter receptor subunit TctC